MKNAQNKLLAVFMVFGYFVLVSHQAEAQVHDFDSLYKSSPEFKSQIKAIMDTLDIFENENVIDVIIKSDFKNLVKLKYKDEYQPAVFTYYLKDTLAIRRNIKIKPRGNMRKSTCFFPPLKLNFPKREVIVKQMKEFDKMKMVLDCKRGAIYEQYLLSEYYAYKILNLLTEVSFRVKLLRVTYRDTSDKYKTVTRHAFLIESIDQLTNRLDALEIKTKHIGDKFMNNRLLAITYLYQYMIGNTDWSIPGMHNIKLIKSKDPSVTKPISIPYDFDYAGIVNTSYAVPDEKLGISSVTDRVYRGVCLPEADIKSAAQKFVDMKEEIYALFHDDALLSKRNKQFTLKYLDGFYEIIENGPSLNRNIIEQCR